MAARPERAATKYKLTGPLPDDDGIREETIYARLKVHFNTDAKNKLDAKKQATWDHTAKLWEAQHEKDSRRALKARKKEIDQAKKRAAKAAEQRAETKKVEKESGGTVTKSHGRRRKHSSDEEDSDIETDPRAELVAEIQAGKRPAADLINFDKFAKSHPGFEVISRKATAATLKKVFPKSLGQEERGILIPQLPVDPSKAELAAWKKAVAAFNSGTSTSSKKSASTKAPAAKRQKVAAPITAPGASKAELDAAYFKEATAIDIARLAAGKPQLNAAQQARLRVETDRITNAEKKRNADGGFGSSQLSGLGPRPASYRAFELEP